MNNPERPDLEQQEEPEAEWAREARLAAEAADVERNKKLEEINSSAEEEARKKLEAYAIDMLADAYAKMGYVGAIPKSGIDSFIEAMTPEQKKKIILGEEAK
ncbi:MAG: hypothetical protein LiPW15_755 [Parcubacteria group bacterium LiPW_15]|nr:MAG: hypothetical protein LiPW15_755 [Parcubacteria group bacterium LiPW_15]